MFLTDHGLSQFISELLLHPSEEYKKVQKAFARSYTANKKRNVFTKVRMDIEADAALRRYFSDNLDEIESWFNIIAPIEKTIKELKNELGALRSKDWEEIR